MMVFLLGAFISSHYLQLDDKHHFSKAVGANFLLTEISEAPTEKRRSDKTVLHVKAYQDSAGLWHNTSGNLLLYTEKDSLTRSLLPGNEIILPYKFNAIKDPANPGEFNYKRYLSFKYIHHQTYLKSGEYSYSKQNNVSLFTVAHHLRSSLQNVLISHGLKDDNLAVASALLLGEKGLLDPEIHQAYAAAGAMHVLAVSGLHVGIIYLILNYVLSFFLRDKNSILKLVIIVSFLWMYALITGLSPSVVRAATMFSAISFGTIIKNKQNIYNTLASSAFVLLLIKPNFLFEVGFQLSYLAVLGIVFLQPRMYRQLNFSNGMMDKVWRLTTVSISAQLATFPLGVLYFHIFPSYFFLSNLVVIPAAVIIMYFGIALFAFSFYPPIAQWISTELIGIIDALNQFVTWIQKLPHAVIDNIYFSVIDTWLLYLLILSGIFFLIKKHVRFLLIGLSAILLLLLAKTYDFYSYKQHDYLCVYHVSKSTAVNFVSHDYNFILDIGHLDIDLEDNPFQMKNNWIRHGFGDATKIKMANLSSGNFQLLDENIIGAFGKTIAVIDQDIKTTYHTPISVDILILTRFKNLHIENILSNFQPETIILDSSFTPYYANKIMDKLSSNQFCHATSVHGGYQKRLN